MFKKEKNAKVTVNFLENPGHQYVQRRQNRLTARLFIAFVSAVFIAVIGYVISSLGPSDFLFHETVQYDFNAVDLFIGYLVSTTLTVIAVGTAYLLVLRKEVLSHNTARREALKLASHDALTGLPNRRRFLTELDAATNKLGIGQCCGIMMLDLDGFKPVNDVYGHSFGDMLLQTFAQRVQEVVGPKGLVARLGGDEFAIVTPPLSSKHEITSIARRISAAVEKPILEGGREVLIGTGIGIAVYPNDGYSTPELLRRADIALYRAKRSGRSVFRFFELEMDASILHRTLLEQRLRSALTKDAIHPHFQPIHDLKTGQIKGFEALARWNDRDFGNVSPEEFIPIAEDSGLISELTESLLQKACDVAKRWPESIYLSFNISALQLNDHNFPLKVVSILNEKSMHPDRLILEITESSLIRHPETAKTILNQLNDIGVRIALDDFGTGYSSLSYLRDYPISKIKIDRSFVASMASKSTSAAIIQAILALSKGLNLEVIAEGIEEADTKKLLLDGGCQYGQGFLFGPAQHEDKLPELPADSKHTRRETA
ncbi:MAG: EAL domain-containing protein [Rhodobacteraceae bacterium]|nr:EAL domain-containing protein [Paracoccaceae bacterium]